MPISNMFTIYVRVKFNFLIFRHEKVNEPIALSNNESYFCFILRAACCNDHLYLCKIEKFDFLKLCHNKGFC